MNWTVAHIASVVLCAMGSGLILSSLGHSPVLGYIIAGILLGPSCFKLIVDKESISVFSDMGIIFLLFAIGLSLSFEKIKDMWKSSFAVTLISTLFIYIFMFIAGYFLKLSHSSIILLSFCMTLSSTAVTVKSLRHLKERNDNIEKNTFGILVAQDIISLVMVLVINFLGTEIEHKNETLKVISTLSFLAVVAFIFLRFKNYAARLSNFIKKHTDMLAMFVFGVCLGSAVLSELFGLSASFGAFAAGLLLGNSSMREEMITIAAPIEEILLMTFFLSVGLLVDIKFILSNFSVIFFGILFITVGKTIINIFVLRLCRFSLKESFVISVLLGHVGEFSFMLAYAASNVGLINDYGVKLLVSLTALSLFLSPFWLIFAERCRTITESVNISSVWAFSQVALNREVTKIKNTQESMVKFFKPITEKVYTRLKKIIQIKLKQLSSKKNSSKNRKMLPTNREITKD